ncbi:NAD-binding protein [Candidatus Woesearchaeota archaeon]|nr:NAD-binding protein [Candidatus Woesearchaeota archaeon]
MKIIIIGGGEIGLTAANVLSTREHDLVLIEGEEKRAKQVANSIDALVIHGDGTDISTLKDAGAADADAIIAATDDDKTNLMVCEISKSLDVKKIVARVNKSENEELFTKLGITGIVPTVGLAVTKIKNLVTETGNERTIYEFGKGEVQVVAITIPKESPLVGKPAALKSATIGIIYRNGELIFPKESTKFGEEDVVILTVQTKNLQSVRKQIYGKGKWK